MLHDGHELNGVVSQILDSGEDVSGKLLIRADTRLRSGNPDMSFINTDVVGPRGVRILEDIFLFGRGIPETCIVDGRDVQILRNAFDPSRQAFNAVAIWEYH